MPSRINSELRVIFSFLTGILLAERTGHQWDSMYAWFAGLLVLTAIHFAAALYLVARLLIERIRESR